MIKTFQRFELKYIIDKNVFEELFYILKENMEYDIHCQNKSKYCIYNIYFDTENDDIIKNSLSKPYYKEKLRLRAYEIPIENTNVFLELKKKIGKSVIKRRAIMKYSDAIEFLKTRNTQKFNGVDRLVLEEIKNHIEKFNVVPKVNIQYDRLAFFDKNDKDIRVSLDNNILTSRDILNFKKLSKKDALLETNKYIMEIKCKGAIPIWLCNVLSKLKIYKTSFSKYGTEYKKYVKNKNLKLNLGGSYGFFYE